MSRLSLTKMISFAVIAVLLFIKFVYFPFEIDVSAKFQIFSSYFAGISTTLLTLMTPLTLGMIICYQAIVIRKQKNNNEINREREITFPNWLNVIAYSVAVILLVVILNYFVSFGWQPIGDREQFGQFGDYIGGLTNPILSFFTIFLLVWSITIQVKELRSTNEQLEASKEELANSAKALENTVKAHRTQYELASKEATRSQIYDALNHHYSQYQEMYKRPVFSLNSSYRVSISQMLNSDKLQVNPKVNTVIESIPTQMENKNTRDIDVVVMEMKVHAGFITTATNELYEHIGSKSVATSWCRRSDEIIETLNSLSILNKDEYAIMKQAIELPESFKNS